MTSAGDPVIFFFDCDNTLLDNDRVRADLDAYLMHEFGADGRKRYWAHYEQLRDETGYADYLGAVQRLQLEAQGDPRLPPLSSFLLDYAFGARLYPDALETIAHCRRWGTTAILSDGDAVFQPRKLQRSGLWDAVEGRVLIYIHKEKMLDDVLARYPAQHLVMIDDKLPILTAMKARLRDRLTTIWPRQGHYALEAARDADRTPADMAVDHIGDLLQLDFSTVLPETQ
jgi:FMN phosphatase YigB (HAD superfamily)